VFGKEKPGRVRCFGRMVTPTVLKRNEEIAAIKRQYSNETTHMSKQLNSLQGLVKLLLRQSNPDLDEEALDNIIENAMDVENNASTSVDMQNVKKVINTFALFL
jgi:Lhr-like helicase